MTLLFAVSFLGYCIFYLALDYYDASESPLIVCVQIILVLYIVALIGKINIAAHILLYGGLAALIGGLLLKRKDLKSLAKKLASPAIIFFFLFSAGLYILCGPVVCVYPDEMAHYGLLPKYMLLADKIPGVDSVVELINYPPGTALFQYYTASFTGGGEGMVFFGQMLLYAALLTIVLKNITWKKLGYGILALAMAIVVLFKFREYNFISLYTDQLAAMAGFFIAASYIKSQKKPADIVKLIPIVFFVPLIRESGISYAVFGSLLILVDSIFRKDTAIIDHTKTDRRIAAWAQKHKMALGAVLLIIIAYLSYKIWNLHVDTFQILTYRGLISAQSLIDGFKELIMTAFKVAEQFVSTSIVDSPGGWAFITTPAGAMLVLIVLSLGINLILKSAGKDEKNTRAMLLTVFIELFIYTAGLVFSYAYLFTDVEGSGLAAFPRYMGGIMVYCGLVVTFILSGTMQRLDRGSLQRSIVRSVAIVFIIMMFIATYPSKYNLYISRTTDNSQQAAMDEKTAGIRSILKPDDKVYQVWQGTFDQTFYFARYSLMVKTNTWGWSLGQDYYDDDIFTSEYTVDEWSAILIDQDFDYVFLGKPDERFWRIYGELFNIVDNPDVDVYKVTPDGDYLLTAWDTSTNQPYAKP